MIVSILQTRQLLVTPLTQYQELCSTLQVDVLFWGGCHDYYVFECDGNGKFRSTPTAVSCRFVTGFLQEGLLLSRSCLAQKLNKYPDDAGLCAV